MAKPPAGARLDAECAAHQLHPLLHAAEAEAAAGPRPCSAPIVGHGHQHVARASQVDIDAPSPGVLEAVREPFLNQSVNREVHAFAQIVQRTAQR